MEGRQHRHAGGRQVFMKVDAGHVHEVDAPSPKRRIDGGAVGHLGTPAHIVVERTEHPWRCGQRALDRRAFASDDDRTMACTRQRGIELRTEEHTSELQSLMRNAYSAVCLKKKITKKSP